MGRITSIGYVGAGKDSGHRLDRWHRRAHIGSAV